MRRAGARRDEPAATSVPDRKPEMTAEKRAAIERVIAMMEKGLPISDGAPRPPFTRDEMHERGSLERLGERGEVGAENSRAACSDEGGTVSSPW